MSDRPAARSAPGASTTNLIVPPSVTIILDHPVEDGDSFTLSAAEGKGVLRKTREATKLDDTHRELTFPIKDNPRRPRTYTLVQNRGGRSVHTIFTNVDSRLLSMDGEKPPQTPEKQYLPLLTDPPDTEDSDLKADALAYGAIEVKEPDTSG